MSRDSRRRFLTGGALAAVGVAATAVTSKPAKAAEPAAQPGSTTDSAGCVSYHPNENLARAIVRAWSDNAFKTRLLTFESGHADFQKPNFESSRAALAEVDIFIERAVVLTQQQYTGYKKKDKEIIFVLPDPLGSTYSLATAQVAMAATCVGM